MFDKMFSVLGDLDVDQLKKVVSFVAENYDRIQGSTNLMWEHGDDILDVVRYVMDHREAIADLLQQLPELLGKTGDCIEAAGTSAVKASALLTGDETDDAMSVRDLANLAAKALDRCQKQLTAAAKIMDSLGTEIDDVRIPTLTPEYSEVMGFSVVSGLELGELAITDKAAGRLKKGSQQISEVGKDFKMVATQMRKIGGTLTKAGGDLNNVGSQLKQSGGLLKAFSGDGTKSAKVLSLKSGSSAKSGAVKKKSKKKKSKKKSGSSSARGATKKSSGKKSAKKKPKRIAKKNSK